MFGLGIGEILIILVAALIFIGPKRLPGMARNLGKGLKEFQDAMRGISNPDTEAPRSSRVVEVEAAESSPEPTTLASGDSTLDQSTSETSGGSDESQGIKKKD